MHVIIFFGNTDVIRIGDLYHAPPIRDKWVVQRRFGNINALGINFWLQRTSCFELLQVMCQSGDQFIEVLNRF
jgi:hypothetical protein